MGWVGEGVKVVKVVVEYWVVVLYWVVGGGWKGLCCVEGEGVGVVWWVR